MQIGRIKEILTLIPKIYRGVISEQINCCEKGEKRAKRGRKFLDSEILTGC